MEVKKAGAWEILNYCVCRSDGGMSVAIIASHGSGFAYTIWPGDGPAMTCASPSLLEAMIDADAELAWNGWVLE